VQLQLVKPSHAVTGQADFGKLKKQASEGSELFGKKNDWHHWFWKNAPGSSQVALGLGYEWVATDPFVKVEKLIIRYSNFLGATSTLMFALDSTVLITSLRQIQISLRFYPTK
jgi:hypothetical protein